MSPEEREDRRPEAGRRPGSRSHGERVIAGVGLWSVSASGPETLALPDAVGALWGALADGHAMDRRLIFKVATPQAPPGGRRRRWR